MRLAKGLFFPESRLATFADLSSRPCVLDVQRDEYQILRFGCQNWLDMFLFKEYLIFWFPEATSEGFFLPKDSAGDVRRPQFTTVRFLISSGMSSKFLRFASQLAWSRGEPKGGDSAAGLDLRSPKNGQGGSSEWSGRFSGRRKIPRATAIPCPSRQRSRKAVLDATFQVSDCRSKEQKCFETMFLASFHLKAFAS